MHTAFEAKAKIDPETFYRVCGGSNISHESVAQPVC